MKNILKLCNISNNSSKIFETLVDKGPQNMSVIAKNTGLVRSSCYTFVKPLIEKGLVSKCNLKGSTYYIAEDPSIIIKNLKQQKKNIDLKIKLANNFYDEFKNNYKKKLIYKRPKVTFYDGEIGLQEAYEDTLKSSEDIRAYANIKEMHDGLPHFFPEYYKRRSDSGIFIHTICPDNKESLERSKLDSKEMREIRFIDMNKYEFTPEINIYDNKVLFASWTEKMAVVIESHEIADFQKKVFDVLYEKLKK